MSDFNEQNFLENVLKAIVKKSDEVVIERKVDELGVLYTVKVSDDDISTVIGKGGQTVQAIRLLLKTVGYKENVRANLKIDSPTPETRK